MASLESTLFGPSVLNGKHPPCQFPLYIYNNNNGNASCLIKQEDIWWCVCVYQKNINIYIYWNKKSFFDLQNPKTYIYSHFSMFRWKQGSAEYPIWKWVKPPEWFDTSIPWWFLRLARWLFLTKALKYMSNLNHLRSRFTSVYLTHVL